MHAMKNSLEKRKKTLIDDLGGGGGIFYLSVFR